MAISSFNIKSNRKAASSTAVVTLNYDMNRLDGTWCKYNEPYQGEEEKMSMPHFSTVVQ
ncbi:hypothetical protein KZX70_07080 [Paenibacillus silvae]|uniref:hypothetical protein n=1 Tax=Paenibacillus silvae TaxID=1325358 RepID=UPI002003A73E|nr:hypothetical protein [Paenibacillus silvae]MCK6074610.1 hypothetical protein [Paenibacillus silvae]